MAGRTAGVLRHAWLSKKTFIEMATARIGLHFEIAVGDSGVRDSGDRHAVGVELHHMAVPLFVSVLDRPEN